MTIAALRKERAERLDELKAIAEAPDGQGGDISEAQEKRFEAVKAELAGLDKRIARQEFIDAADRQAAGEPVTGQDMAFETECRNFSILRAIGAAIGLNVDNGREREISAELQRRSGVTPEGVLVPLQVFEKRVVTTAAPAGGPGSNLVATEHRPGEYIDRLRAALVTARLGARTLSGLMGNLNIPGLQKSATSAWVAENNALSAADAEFRQVQMTPKHCGALMELSRNMLMQTSPDVEDLIRSDMALVLAEAIDQVALVGGGANEPEGIIKTLDGTTPESGATAFATSMIATAATLIAGLDTANAMPSRAFVTTSGIKGALIAKVDADGKPFTLADHFHGEPTAVSNLLPTDLGTGSNEHATVYGDFSDLMIGYWSQVDILPNPYESAAYAKGNVQLRAMMTADVALRHAASFAYTFSTLAAAPGA